MNERFDENEFLLRAVYPENLRPEFWDNGRLSSAALKDEKGLSVTRTYDRTLIDSVCWMRNNFKGPVFSITVKDCNEVEAYVKYKPTRNNKYHSEIHRSNTVIELSDIQALILARKAVLQFYPQITITV